MLWWTLPYGISNEAALVTDGRPPILIPPPYWSRLSAAAIARETGQDGHSTTGGTNMSIHRIAIIGAVLVSFGCAGTSPSSKGLYGVNPGPQQVKGSSQQASVVRT